MKKKVKLITTIASLGLALALMAFGVYAALTVSFNVTSQVSFTAAANVNVKFTAAVTTTGSATLSGEEGTVETKTYDTYNDPSFNETDEKEFETIALKNVTLVAAGDTCTYTFTVANYSEFAVTVTVTKTSVPAALTLGTGETANTYVSVADTVAESFNVPAFDGTIANSTVSQTIVVTLNRTDKTYDQGALNLGFSVTEKTTSGN